MAKTQRGAERGVLRDVLALSFLSSCCLILSHTVSPQTVPSSKAGYAPKNEMPAIAHSASSVKSISQVAFSPDGKRIAFTIASTGQVNGEDLFIASISHPDSPMRVEFSADVHANRPCRKAEPAWSPDASKLAFLSDCASLGQMQLFLINISRLNSEPRKITSLRGYLSQPKWSPDGRTIAFLFADHASRAPSPLAAASARTGVIDDLQNLECPRIVLFNAASGVVRLFSPPALAVFEYDWAPEGRAIAYTAASPPGDDNWYIAQLYKQELTEPQGRSIYTPKFQIALPRWSRDGESIAFIEGLMSDQGVTGGEII